jgi:hypothetical protein
MTSDKGQGEEAAVGTHLRQGYGGYKRQQAVEEIS